MKKIIIAAIVIVIFGFFIFQAVSPDDYAKLGGVFLRLSETRYKSDKSDSARVKLGRLYYDGGKYDLACETVSALEAKEAQKVLALSLYQQSKFTEALGIFNKLGKLDDAEYLYYYGLTCEKSNLHDEAEKIYQKIGAGIFKSKAEERLRALSHLVGISADTDILAALANSPQQEDYPEAGALILSVKEKMEIFPDNTSVSDAHMLIKILNDRGKEAFSEVVLGYDSTYERVEVEFARTIKPDGTAVLVGDKNIRDVSVYLNFPLYSNARAKIISMPEVTSGCLIEYKARTYNSKLAADKHFSTVYFLQEAEPVLYSSFRLVVPKERKINTKIINPEYNKLGVDLILKLSEGNGKAVYDLEVKNIPQILPEPAMPPRAEIDSALLISSFASWDEIFNWWSGFYKDKIIPDENIKKKTEELTRNLISPREKAQAIHNFCAQEIRYVAVEYGQAGYEPHRASDIFLNKYGDCKDQAVLLITMLRYAGLEAYPVLIGTKGTIALAEDFPALYFNHAIAALKLDDELIFMDPTAETTSFGDLPAGDNARMVLLIRDDKYQIVRTPDFTAKHNLINTETAITINPDETIKAERAISSSGLYEQARRYWLIYTMPSLIEEAIKSRVQEFSANGRLLDYTVENARNLDKPIIFNYRFEGSDFLTKAGRARVMPSPGSVDVSMIVKDERNYPIDLGILSEEVETFKVDVPYNLRFKHLPESIRIDNPWLLYSLDYVLEGNSLKCTERIVAKKKYISVSEYPQYKAFITDLARRLNQAVILEEVDAAKKSRNR